MRHILVTIFMFLLGAAALGATVYAVQGFSPFNFIWDFSTYNYAQSEKYTAGDAVINDKINNLDIDWISGSVSVEYHDEKTILVKETASRQISSGLQLHWRVDGDTLSVKYARSGAHLKSGLNKDLVITLPRSAQPENADIDNTTGAIRINGGTWKQLDLDTTTGAVNVSADSAEELSAKAVTGDIDINVTAVKDIRANAVTGVIAIAADDFGSVKASATNGRVTARLPEKPGFTAELSAVTGKIECGLEHIDTKGKCIVGDGSRSVKIKTVTGDIEIRTK